MPRIFATVLLLIVSLAALPAFAADAAPKKLVLLAGKPSHPPRMHEFNAGVQLLAKSLKDFKDVKVEVILNGWPKDESIFDGAAAVVFYMDGGPNHEAVKDNGKRLPIIDGWVKKGVGLGFMHYGVEIVPAQAGDQFKRWMGGHYEHMFSCNPMWEPKFTTFPDHPITRGVKPFTIKDEWYFNMRFAEGLSGDKSKTDGDFKFWPILVAKPSDQVRDGPYVYPRGPYKHIQDAKGRDEAMMWATQRTIGREEASKVGDAIHARAFGFTGGHFHDNWGNDEFRKVVLNALVWISHAEVPKDGVESKVTKEDLDANLDPKGKK